VNTSASLLASVEPAVGCVGEGVRLRVLSTGTPGLCRLRLRVRLRGGEPTQQTSVVHGHGLVWLLRVLRPIAAVAGRKSGKGWPVIGAGAHPLARGRRRRSPRRRAGLRLQCTKLRKVISTCSVKPSHRCSASVRTEQREHPARRIEPGRREWSTVTTDITARAYTPISSTSSSCAASHVASVRQSSNSQLVASSACVDIGHPSARDNGLRCNRPSVRAERSAVGVSSRGPAGPQPAVEQGYQRWGLRAAVSMSSEPIVNRQNCLQWFRRQGRQPPAPTLSP
jgi:hypothetical protein